MDNASCFIVFEAAEVADEGRARLAYQRLFGDSLGLDGGDPMPWKDFSERALVAQALPGQTVCLLTMGLLVLQVTV